ncbi:hypothetical protein N8Z47_01280 [Salibacteraceae bacterium]|nr:hypothetical protein [Salibacteraceae bacterium]
MVNTSIGRELGPIANWIFSLLGVSPEKGAETLLYLSSVNSAELTYGEFYAKKEIKKITDESYNMDSAARLIQKLETKLI